MSNNSAWSLVVIILLLLGLVFGIPLTINHHFNDKEMRDAAYVSHSYAKGLGGHVEYTVYTDGRTDIKIYPGWGHRLFDSVLYQDLDGDGKIDVIRENGPEWKNNSLQKLLVRSTGYAENKEYFEKADGMLRELRQKYPN